MAVDGRNRDWLQHGLESPPENEADDEIEATNRVATTGRRAAFLSMAASESRQDGRAELISG